jgi:hypothetical protein
LWEKILAGLIGTFCKLLAWYIICNYRCQCVRAVLPHAPASSDDDLAHAAAGGRTVGISAHTKDSLRHSAFIVLGNMPAGKQEMGVEVNMA